MLRAVILRLNYAQIVAILTLCTILVAIPAQVVSARSAKDAERLFPLYGGEEKAPTCGGTMPGVGNPAVLSQNIPNPWRDLIANAAPKYPDADARLVAAVLWAENRGWPEYRAGDWAQNEGSGASGPWQFIPQTWFGWSTGIEDWGPVFDESAYSAAGMGRDGNGDGRRDPQDPADAVEAAFVHMRDSAGLPLADIGYTGNADADFNTIVFDRDGGNLLKYGANYNGSGAPSGVVLSNFPRGENSDYVRMVYWLIATDFAKGWMPQTDQYVDAAASGAGAGGSAIPGTASGGVCPSGASGTVNSEGYSFPVGPQKKSQVNSGGGLPCTIPACHGDSTAALDIGAPGLSDEGIGRPVYAISNGTIYNLKIYGGQEGCYSFHVVSAKDNFYYWYGHVRNPSVAEGAQVTAGQKIAEIGEGRCSINPNLGVTEPRPPHLHIDRGCILGGVPQPGGSDKCRDPDFIPLMNKLWQEMPE